MKKLLVILSLCFMVIQANAKQYLYCFNGQAYEVNVSIDPLTGLKVVTMIKSGGCYGYFIVELNMVAPLEDPDVDEADPNIYNSVNALKINQEVNDATVKAAFLNDFKTEEANGTIAKVWIDPAKIDKKTYKYFYTENVFDLAIYELKLSINANTGKYHVKLFSDIARTVKVTFTDAYGVVQKTSELNLDAGKNNNVLNTNGLAPGIYNVAIISEKNTIYVKVIVNA